MSKKSKKAGAIIFDESLTHILLICGRKSQKWGPPKGHLDPDEDLFSGAVREVLEETGVNLEFCHNAPWVTIEKVKFIVVKISYYTRFIISDTHEISDLRWVPLDNLEEYLESITKVLYGIFRKRRRLRHMVRGFV